MLKAVFLKAYVTAGAQCVAFLSNMRHLETEVAALLQFINDRIYFTNIILICKLVTSL